MIEQTREEATREAVDRAYAQGKRDALDAVEQDVLSLAPYEDGRISKGLALHAIERVRAEATE